MNVALVLGLPAALAAAALGLATCHHATPKFEQARQQAAVAATQANLTSTVSAAQSQATTKTVRVLITTQQAIHDVTVAPGASTPLPPDLLARFDAGVAGVRRAADTDATNAVGDDPGRVGRALPAR